MAFIVLKNKYPELFSEVNNFLFPVKNYIIKQIQFCKLIVPHTLIGDPRFCNFWTALTISHNQWDCPVSQSYKRYVDKYDIRKEREKSIK